MKTHGEIIKENLPWAREMLVKVDEKMSEVTLRSRDRVVDGVDGFGRHKDTPPSNWTSGFFGGLNLLLYEHTKNPDYLLTAKRSEEILDSALADFNCLIHDVGFMWHILSGAIYRLTGDEGSKNRNLHAAASLSSRFVLGGNFIRAWNDENVRGWIDEDVSDWTIIDCMMNLPLLYWASDAVGDDRFKRLAMAHADTTLRTHIRPDGSVAHCVKHDRENGDALASFTGQGYSPDSSWSRGQSWALYGFTLSYLHTGEVRYLDAAKRVAHYFISSVCSEWIPRLDFRAPTEPAYYDTTAGVIAACGLIELGKILPSSEGGLYTSAAVKMLRAISGEYLDTEPENDCLILGGSVRYPLTEEDLKKDVIHKNIIYGDYFFVEALLKLVGSDFNPWLSR